MKLRRNEEIINHPCQNWTDENGTRWSRPTLAFLQARGFAEYTAPAVPPTPEQIAQDKKYLIAAISAAAREAVESEANAALQDQMWANYKSDNPHPYTVANVEWGKSVYVESEIRKSMVEAGTADDYSALCDFSSFGQKPHTVYQLYLAGVVEL